MRDILTTLADQLRDLLRPPVVQPLPVEVQADERRRRRRLNGR
ncbi:MAG: hypothetical protein AAF547_08135 [Actinomycetota bacterium]